MEQTQHPGRQFASDNWAGFCPEAWAGLAAANRDHAAAYGEDPWTKEAINLIQHLVGSDCPVFLVFTGTAANALAAASTCNPFHSIICHEIAHLEEDECGASGYFAHGVKLVPVPGNNGKLTPEVVERAVTQRADVHHSKPRLLSLTQATELGTVYSATEVSQLTATAHRLGLRVHVDGARFANAVASLGIEPSELLGNAGVDVLSLGGAKNGLGFGEAVVFFDKDLASEFDYRRKQAGQLASKMRFLAGQWVGILREGAWLRNALYANNMASYLEHALREIPGIRLLVPRQANSVFVGMPEAVAESLRRRGWRFHRFPRTGGYRLMCAWDTRPEDIDSFTRDLIAIT